MLALFETHLRNSGLFSDVIVAESTDMISGRATAAEDGAVVLVPWREKGRPMVDATYSFRQIIDVQVVTALVSRLHDDPRGGGRALVFDARRALTEELLSGWQPLPESESVSLVGAEGHSVSQGVSIYVQTWQTTRFLTAN